MKLFRNLEYFFENRIEGFFRRKFNDTLHPLEIAKKLVREMEDNRKVSVSTIYVPNRYTVFFHSHKLSVLVDIQHTLQDELCNYLLNIVMERGYTASGQVEVLFANNDELQENDFKVEVAFAETDPSATGPTEQDTLIFASGVSVTEQNRLTTLPMVGQLLIIEGIQAGVAYPVGKKRVGIGRWEGNEICLRDPSLSRVHAVIESDEGGHVLTDARSLNGTYVNEQRVSRKMLNSGDKIRIGQTVLLYEVKH